MTVDISSCEIDHDEVDGHRTNVKETLAKLEKQITETEHNLRSLTEKHDKLVSAYDESTEMLMYAINTSPDVARLVAGYKAKGRLGVDNGATPTKA